MVTYPTETVALIPAISLTGLITSYLSQPAAHPLEQKQGVCEMIMVLLCGSHGSGLRHTPTEADKKERLAEQEKDELEVEEEDSDLEGEASDDDEEATTADSPGGEKKGMMSKMSGMGKAAAGTGMAGATKMAGGGLAVGKGMATGGLKLMKDP